MSRRPKTLLAILLGLGMLLASLFLLRDGEYPGNSHTGTGQSPAATSAATESTGIYPGEAANQVTIGDRGANSETSPGSPALALDPFEGFARWVSRYRQATSGERGSFLDAGIALAEARRPLMRRLIHENPEIALAHALSLDEYHALPEPVRALVEEPFSARAEIDVFPRCDNRSAAIRNNLRTSQGVDIHLTRPASDDGETEILDAFTYGWRLEAPSRTATPVQGIELDGLAAVRREIFQQLSASEIPVAENLYPVANLDANLGFATGLPLPREPVVALAGGQLFYFADPPAFDAFEGRAATLELKLGPTNGAGLILDKLAAMAADPGNEEFLLPMGEVEEEGEDLATANSTSIRKVLMIRVDFSDKTGSPIGVSTLQNRMDGEVDQQCRDMSFDKLGLDTTVASQLVRMPRPSSYYNGNDGSGTKKNSALYNDAIAAAQAAGIDTSGYQHRCIVMKGIGMGYCGLATVGGGKIWLPCHGSKVIVHELGHNFGVSHASFHDPNSDSDPLGGGSSSEYGDNTDIMGGGGVPSGHFHPQFKSKLGWLEGAQRYNFNSGNTGNTYRIYRYDHPGTDPANVRRAVRVYRGTNNEYLWIGYRQRFTGSNYQNYLKGAQVHWQKAGKSKSWLVDLTPGGGKNNSGIGIGRTFSDTRKDIHITALKRGGSNPNQWLEVQVTRGPFAGNGAPSISSIPVPTRVPVNESIPVGALADDPDGDPLVYHFDFQDGKVIGNDGTASSRAYTWTSTGSKSITVTVSDRKGQTAQKDATVTVQNRLDPPANLTASDDDHRGIALSWGDVPGGTSYAVFRSETNSPATAGPIGTVPSTQFFDASAAFETTYFYWVQALGSNAASKLGNSDAGLRIHNPPDSPGDLTATRGIHTDHVLLTWVAIPRTDTYRIYRGVSQDPGEATAIGQTPSTRFTDDTAEPGTAYHYWIRGVNSSGPGEFSAAVIGARRLHRPTGVEASEGYHDREIMVTWSEVEGADAYEIFRSDGSGDPALVGTTSDLSFADTPPDELTRYDYTVRARSEGSGHGDHSSSDSGYRTIAPPENVAATDGYYDDKVIVSWTAVSGVNPVYKVYRSEVGGGGGGARLLGNLVETSFDDELAEPGVPYHYFVRVTLESVTVTHHSNQTVLNNVASPLSAAESGHRAENVRFRPDGLIGKRPSSLAGNNLYNLTGSGQQARLLSKRGRKVACFYQVQHDGEAAPALVRVFGSRSDRNFRIAYREITRPFANVTAPVTLFGYLVELEPAGARLLRIEASPSRKARFRSKRRQLKILAFATEVRHRGDTVRAFIQTRRRR